MDSNPRLSGRELSSRPPVPEFAFSFRMLGGQEIQHKFMDSGFKSRIFFKYLRYFFLHTLFLQISITVIEIAATSSVSGDSPLNKT